MNAPLAYADANTGLPQEGEVWSSRYRIERRIATGGMAAVYSAVHLRLDQRVAIKVLHPELCDNEQVMARFAREGRATTKIRSEHVVRVHDVDEEHGRPYLVMEYLDGQDLADAVATGGPLSPEIAVDYVLQACEAIAEAHSIGIVHRDLKPANLFLTRRPDGSPLIKVIDFGISKVSRQLAPRVSHLTASSLLMGSPHYMSPEQVESASDVDARSDIWAIGVILHELVSGHLPFESTTVTGLCTKILCTPPPPLTSVRPDAPNGLEEVVLRCLEKDRAKRYPSIDDLARALAPFASESGRASVRTIVNLLHRDDPVVEAPSAPPVVCARELVGLTSPATRRSRRAGYWLGAALALGAAGSVGHLFMPELAPRVATWAATMTLPAWADAPASEATVGAAQVTAPPAAPVTAGDAGAPPVAKRR